MLVVFALSFFGWFEIKLPEKWGNAVDTKASSTTGLLSIFLMAFTLTLVSFSCTGPIIGFLLVASTTSGSLLGPAFGMLGFAVYTVCHVPKLAEERPEVGLMDGHNQDSSRLH